jgi:hypothetical protein
MVWSLLALGGLCDTKLPVCNCDRDLTSFRAFLVRFPQHQTSLTTSTSSQSTYHPSQPQPQPQQQQTTEMKQPPMKPAPKRDAVDKSAPKPKPWYARPSWVSKPTPKPKPVKPTARADTFRPKAVYRAISEMEGSMAPDSPLPPGSLPKIKTALKLRGGAVAAAQIEMPVRVRRDPVAATTADAPLPSAPASLFSFDMPVRPKVEPEGNDSNNVPPPSAPAPTFSHDMPVRTKKESSM